ATVRVWRMTCAAITGVACVSITITASSPTTTPVLGSPSAVYAYALSESLVKVTFLSARSAWEANALLMAVSVGGRRASLQRDGSEARNDDTAAWNSSPAST